MARKLVILVIIVAIPIVVAEQVPCSPERVLSIETPRNKTFQARPITAGLRGATAYTLNKGEWKIGYLSISSYTPLLESIDMNYGVTKNLQLGTELLANFLGNFNISGKYRLSPTPNIKLAIPLGLYYHQSSDNSPFQPPIRPYVSVSSGTAISWTIYDKLDFHTGIRIQASSIDAFKVSSLYAIVDLSILSNMKLLSELDFYPIPLLGSELAVRIGVLIRLLRTLNLKATATFHVLSYAPSTYDLGADLFFRF